MGNLPNVLIVGTAKSGTTTLSNTLEKHPDVFFPRAKELNFFSYDSLYCLGIDYYKQYFEQSSGCKVVCEKSWTYSVCNVYPETINRITENLDVDNLKIVYIVREPIQRLKSFWIEMISNGYKGIPLSFDRAIIENNIFLDSSLYFRQLNRFREFLPDEKIKIIFFENLIKNFRGEIEDTLSFLELDNEESITSTILHSNPTKGKMVDTKYLHFLRKLPFFDQIKKHSPAQIRNYFSSRLKQEFFGKPSVCADTRALICDYLRADIVDFLDWTGVDFNRNEDLPWI